MNITGNYKYKNRGYTLVEIVIIIAIVGIIISGILPVFLNSITANKSAEYYSKAYKILDSKMEEYRNSNFDTLDSTTFDVPELPQGQGTLTITDNVEGAPQNDIKQAELKIVWNFKNEKEVKIVTYIARGGLKN